MKSKYLAISKLYQAIFDSYTIPKSLKFHNLENGNTLFEINFPRCNAENEFLGDFKKLVLRDKNNNFHQIPDSLEAKSDVEIYSPSKAFKAVFKEKSCALVEGSNVLFTFSTKDNGLFPQGRYSWSLNEKQFVYCSHIKRKPQKTIFETNEKDTDFNFFKSFEFEDDFGECLEGTKNFQMKLVNIEERTQKAIDIGNMVALNPLLIESKLYFTGYELKPYDIMGFNYCPFRPYKLLCYDLKEEKVSEFIDDELVYMMVANEERTKFVYFTTDKLMKPHIFSTKIKMIDLESKEKQVLAEIEPKINEENKYSGFYTSELVYPSIIWEKTNVYFLSYYKGSQHYYSLNTETKEITKITPSLTNLDHWEFLNYNKQKNEVYLSLQNFKSVPKIAVFSLENHKVEFFETFKLGSQLLMNKMLEKIEEHVLELESGSNSIILQSSNETDFKSLPEFKEFVAFYGINNSELEEYFQTNAMVHFYHGGPHVMTAFSPFQLICLLFGYKIAMPNYCGTLGFGDELLCRSLGNAKEVDEVKELTLKAIEFGKISNGKSVTFGGSYGGFMSYLMNSSPEMKESIGCSIALNGVCDNYSMYTQTDIRKFLLGEQLNKDEDHILTEEDILKFYQLSPFSKEPLLPLLIILGGKDRRCPFSQNLTYFKDWKGRGKDVRCYFYPDAGHGLSLNENIKYDLIGKTFNYFNEHLKNSN